MEGLYIAEFAVNFRRNGHIEFDNNKMSVTFIDNCNLLVPSNNSKDVFKCRNSRGSRDNSEGSFYQQIKTFGDIILTRQQLRTGCEKFSSYEEIAYNIVDDVLDSAVAHIRTRYLILLTENKNW